MEKKKTQRLSVDLKEETHCLIKTLATQKRITIKRWLEGAIKRQIDEDEDLGWIIK